LRGGKLGLWLARLGFFHLGDNDLGLFGTWLQLIALLGDEGVHGVLDEEFAIGVGLDGVEQESVLDKEAAEVIAVFVGGAMLGVLSIKMVGDGFEEIGFHLEFGIFIVRTTNELPIHAKLVVRCGGADFGGGIGGMNFMA